jgi:NTE family protein/lysophospholipid hydrolase
VNESDSRHDSQSEVMTLLASTGLFDVLDRSALEAVEAALEPVRVSGGDVLFCEGDPGDCLYVVSYGRLAISVARDGAERVIAEIGRGEVVGEMAVLTGEPRSATVRAARDTGLVRFPREAFERLVESRPHVMMLVARRIVTRLRDMNKARPVTNLKTVAVVPLARDAATADFAARLVEALGRIGPTLHLDRRAVEQRFGAGAAAAGEGGRGKVGAWLDEQEAAYRYIVYACDAEDSPWTSLCVRQADRLLLAAPGGRPPAGDAYEKTMLDLCGAKAGVRREAVLLHAAGAGRPSGTAAWLDRIGAPDAHHHVHDGAQDDVDRLARLLTGRAVGLVLGGGGARGLAHIGVLRAFRELGIPIDVIGGTSMGSVIAGQCAMGLDHEALVELNRKGWIDADPFRDKTLPVMALLACRKLDRMLEMMFGDARIEDLPIGYFCVSANLTQAEEIVHREGPLAGSIRASLAIPGVALPVCREGDLLVDGGVLNNLPGDVMRDLCGGSVIVVDVSPQKDLSVDPAFGKAPSSWQVIGSRLNPFARSIKVPSVLAIMTRTLVLSSKYRTNQVKAGADLYIRPPVDGFGLFEWKSLDALADAGFRQGMEALRAWREAEPSDA